MSALVNPKVPEFIKAGRHNYIDQRAQFYRAHEKSALVTEVTVAISQQAAPNIPTLKQYFLIGNERFTSIIRLFEDMLGKLSDPAFGEYDQANKACIDARSLTQLVYDHIERTILTERTAGSIVRSAHAFRALSAEGVGFVIVHDSCGALKAAHDYYTGKFSGPLDEHLQLLLEGGIHTVVAMKEDPKRRTEHGISQAEMANLAITDSRKMVKVFPVCSVLNGGDERVVSGVELLNGLKDGRPNARAYTEAMDYAAKTLWAIAAEMGRKKTQFAHTIFVYDAIRMGRFADPRIFLDLLPNEAVCVTFDFEQIMRGSISKNGIAGVKYAAFHGGGHIKGVGGEDGNRHIMVIDPDPEVTMRVETALLNSCPEARDLTRNGETIIRTRYDLGTREIEFLD